MDDDAPQEVFERGNEGELEPTSIENENHGENAVVDDHEDTMDDLSEDTQELIEECGDEYPTREKEEPRGSHSDATTVSSSQTQDDDHPDTLTIRVPLDDRHSGMVSDIQDAGVSVEQQLIEECEFMMFVDQRIHGHFSSLKYSDGGSK